MPIYNYTCSGCYTEYNKLLKYEEYKNEVYYCTVCECELDKEFPIPGLFKGLPTNKFYSKE